MTERSAANRATSLTRDLVDLVDTIGYADFESEDLRAVRTLLLDHVGVAASGAATDSAGVVRRFVEGLESPTSKDLPVIGAQRRIPCVAAAMANATAGHCIEYDDLHNASSSHPGTVVIPAAMAAATIAEASDSDFVEAIVVGYEVMCRVGRAVNPAAHYERHFHPTATVGSIGATATISRLFGLDAEQTVCAIGVACDTAAGSMSFLTDGSWIKRWHPAMAVRNGFDAARLAREGFVGSVDGIGGPRGFLAAYSADPHPDLLLDRWGVLPLEVRTTSIKAHACCRYNQGAIDALLQIRSDHHLVPHDIRAVVIGLPSASVDLVAEPSAAKRRPESVMDAQFSMPYAAAVALVRGRAGVDEYAPELLGDADLRTLMDVVTCETDPRIDRDYPEQWHAWARVETGDGRSLEAWVEDPKGDPPNPLSLDELDQKFSDLSAVAYGPGERDRIMSAVSVMGEPGSLADLLEVL